jgi:hypothetical protein
MLRAIIPLLLFLLTLFNQNFAQSKKYIPADGKVIGIWPHNNRLASAEKLSELKNRWGFNSLLIAAIYGKKEFEMADNAGFESAKILYQIYLPDIQTNRVKVLNSIKEIGKIGGYYFDEPISRKQSLPDFLWLLKVLSEEGFYPHAQFVMSEINEYRAKQVDFLVDEIMYSGYGTKENLGLDQQKTWIEWKKVLGSKLSMIWISSLEDSDHYRTLFKAAQELEMRGVWFYQLEPLNSDKECDDANFEKFCEAAVEFGFMKVLP